MIDIDEIETLARLATPGPWAIDSDSVNKYDRLYVAKGSTGDLQGRVLEVFANCLVTSDEERYVNAAFIAAANPATILALIAEVRALRADAERYRWLRQQPNDTTAPRIDVVQWQEMDESANEGHGLRLDELDATIDAARGAK